MALETISLSPGTPSSRQRVVLDGVEFVLELRWSEREEAWYLDLRDATATLLVGGIKIVANWPLLYRFRSVEGLPVGDLMAVDSRLPPTDPTLTELGDAVPLCYGSFDDLSGALVRNVS